MTPRTGKRKCLLAGHFRFPVVGVHGRIMLRRLAFTGVILAFEVPLGIAVALPPGAGWFILVLRML
jgi:hypothetical protein